MKFTTVVAFILVLLGALTWLLIGLVGFNLVDFVAINSLVVSRVIYVIVGLAGLWMIFYSFMFKPFNDLK